MKILIAFLLPFCMFAQMSAMAPVPIQQPLSNGGLTLPGGCLYIFAAGTSTPQNTWSDSALSHLNPQPIVLDASGRAPAIYQNVSLKMVLAQKSLGSCLGTPGTVLWSQDNVFDAALALKSALAAPGGAGLIGFEPTGGNTPITVAVALNTEILDVGFTSLLSACAAAVAAGKNLVLTLSWDANGTCAASIQARKGGIIAPTTGHTVTLTGSFDGDQTQHFSTAGGGLFATSSGFSVEHMNVKWWGATGNGTTDDGPSVRSALNNLASMNASELYVPSGQYKMVPILISTVCPTCVNSTQYAGALMPTGAYVKCESSPAPDTGLPSGFGNKPIFIPGADNMRVFSWIMYPTGLNYTVTNAATIDGCAFDQTGNGAGYTSVVGIDLVQASNRAVVRDVYWYGVAINQAGIRGGGAQYLTIDNSACDSSQGRLMDFQASYSYPGNYFGVANGVTFKDLKAAGCNQGVRVDGYFTMINPDYEGTLPVGTQAAFDFGCIADTGCTGTYANVVGGYTEGTSASSGDSSLFYFDYGQLSIVGGTFRFIKQSGASSAPCVNIPNNSTLFTINIQGNQFRSCSTGIYLGEVPQVNSSTTTNAGYFGGMSVGGNQYLNVGTPCAFRSAALLTNGNQGAWSFSCPNIGSTFSNAVTSGFVNPGDATVSTSGTAVTAAGAFFAVLNWPGNKIIINGTQYTVASVTDFQHLTLTSTAGTQSGVVLSPPLDPSACGVCDMTGVTQLGVTAGIIPGQQFTVKFGASVTIPTALFHLYRQADITTPASGNPVSLNFYVDPSSNIREVGSDSGLIPGPYMALPSCGSSTADMHVAINDANTTTFNATVSAGGGIGHGTAICVNGTGWIFH